MYFQNKLAPFQLNLIQSIHETSWFVFILKIQNGGERRNYQLITFPDVKVIIGIKYNGLRDYFINNNIKLISKIKWAHFVSWES